MASEQTTLPPNPRKSGWHRLETVDGGCSMIVYWNAPSRRWDDSPANQITPEEMHRLSWRWQEALNV